VQRPRLTEGARCWLVHECGVYEVTVSEVRDCLQGDPLAFTMYRVKCDHHPFAFIEGESQHRSDLFRKTDERGALRRELENRVDLLRHALSDLEDEDDG